MDVRCIRGPDGNIEPETKTIKTCNTILVTAKIYPPTTTPCLL